MSKIGNNFEVFKIIHYWKKIERETKREIARHRVRERQIKKERKTKRDRERNNKAQRKRKRERQKETEREITRHREREREKDKNRKRGKKIKITCWDNFNLLILFNNIDKIWWKDLCLPTTANLGSCSL